MGPSRVNPYTGQILDADIIFDADFLTFWKQEYETLNSQSIAEMTGGALPIYKEHEPRPQAIFDERPQSGADCNLATGMSMQLAFGAAAILAGADAKINEANLEKLIPPVGGRTVAEAIDNNLRAVEEHAEQTGREILVHLNHPNFGYAITAEDLAAVLRERFVEVYNGHNAVNHLGDEHRASVEQIWDIANTIRLGQLAAPPLFGIATDDSHTYHGQEGARPGRGWTMVRAAQLEPETLIKAIKAGDMYASSGVTLQDVQYDPQTKVLKLQIAAEDGVEYTTQFIGTKTGYDPASEPRVDAKGKPLRTTRKYSSDIGQVFATVSGTAPSYKLTGEELYVRAVVTSTKPHANPSFKDQREQACAEKERPEAIGKENGTCG